jgi:hypothetical protein
MVVWHSTKLKESSGRESRHRSALDNGEKMLKTLIFQGFMSPEVVTCQKS